MSGKFFAIASTRSSQYGMVMAMPFDLVAEVRCFFGVLRASSKANLSTRSTPMRVSTVSCITTSRSVPGKMPPPIEEYSPSVFSRTTQKSMSPGLRPASGEGTPGISRTGRSSAARSVSTPHPRQVAVLIKRAAERDERAPQRNMVGDFRRPADRTEEDRVMRADALLPVLRHHALVLGVVVVGREVEIVLAQLEAEFLRRRLEHPHALGHDLLADAVAGNDGDAVDAVGGHGRGPFDTRVESGERLAKNLFLVMPGKAGIQ